MDNKRQVCGIIAEYNPFHNGHKYQLELVKKQYGTVVVVMSGSLTQRGDVAITDKWSRSRSALLSGADLVIELPVIFALNTAERFAFGGINVLSSLGCVDAISFGSECADADVLKEAAEMLINETPVQAEKLQQLMKSGMAYAAAREQVFSHIPAGILREPNNILAVEYIKQLILAKSPIQPITHKRVGSDYNSTELESKLSSASAIRANAQSPYIKNQMPENVYEIFEKSTKHYLSGLDTAAVYFIRQGGAEALKASLECVEGLENRIYEAARRFDTIEKIADACSTKRYTKAKIRRVILASMLGITSQMCFEQPSYARVLGATENGRNLLSEIKNKSKLNIITKTADFKEENEMFKKDILATDIWALTSNETPSAGQDFTKSPVMI